MEVARSIFVRRIWIGFQLGQDRRGKERRGGYLRSTSDCRIPSEGNFLRALTTWVWGVSGDAWEANSEFWSSGAMAKT